VRQLDPASRLMTRLRDGVADPTMRVTSIGATDDAVVTSTATKLAGARHVTVNPAGANDHSRILTDPQAMRAARRALEHAPPRCVGWVEGIRGAIEPVVIRRAELTAGHVVHALLDPPIGRIGPSGSPVPIPIGVPAPSVASR
jgi:hypothetical protein